MMSASDCGSVNALNHVNVCINSLWQDTIRASSIDLICFLFNIMTCIISVSATQDPHDVCLSCVFLLQYGQHNHTGVLQTDT